MRISDWSSDVCSSDLHAIIDVRPFGMMVHFFGDDRDARHEAERLREIGEGEAARDRVARRLVRPFRDRKSVVSGTRVSVRVDLGGRRNLKQKKQQKYCSKV